MQKGLKGALIATAVAGLFFAKASVAAEQAGGGKDAGVKCMGANECKGKGACGVPGKHDCHGQNECKGKGWVKVSSAEECTKKNGTVVK